MNKSSVQKKFLIANDHIKMLINAVIYFPARDFCVCVQRKKLCNCYLVEFLRHAKSFAIAIPFLLLFFFLVTFSR